MFFYLYNTKRIHTMKKQIRIRCWIDIDGVKFFGPGPAELLQLIAETGSISKAAKTMGMSYKKAWDIVNQLNTRGPKPFVTSHKGGEKGGGAELTESGAKVVKAYSKLTKQLDTVISKNTELLKLL
jgi:molybdate transport system regulatory protein